MRYNPSPVVFLYGAVGGSVFHPYKALFGNDCRRLKMRKSVSDDAQQFMAVAIKEQKVHSAIVENWGQVACKDSVSCFLSLIRVSLITSTWSNTLKT